MIDAAQHKTETKEFRDRWIGFIYDLQHKICKALEDVDGKAKFTEDEWQRAEGKGGGGLTKVIQNGNVFEKGGVNTSVVYGKVSRKMREVLHLPLSSGEATWFAAGISSVIHPYNPFVPTIHFNYRMFELYDKGGMLTDRWFGGGTDLTPYYLFEEDAIHFHSTLKQTCDAFDEKLYPLFKHNCDEYFVNTHRNNERRGIGGIFYDHRREAPSNSPKGGETQSQSSLVQDDNIFLAASKSRLSAKEAFPLGRWGWADFAKACGNAFIDAYIPIAEKRKRTAFTEAHKHWQEIRRGRYVEFNLIHDKGTLFGLKTGGRTESILMSLPATVRFEYNYQPEAGSEEDKLLQVCLKPKDWV
jgi:coproporphyrinogen III oxidase